MINQFGDLDIHLQSGGITLSCLLSNLNAFGSSLCSQRLPFLEQALAKVNTSDPYVISTIISRFSDMPKLKAESPYHK